MKPYSIDLRTRIVQALTQDQKTAAEVSALFRVSTATIYRYLQLHRDLNDLTPLTGTGRPRLISNDHEPDLLEQIQANTDLTLEEHCQLWHKRTGMTISITCMFESQKRLAVTLKKSDHAREVRLMVKKRFTLVNASPQTGSPG
jgi:transposase